MTAPDPTDPGHGDAEQGAGTVVREHLEEDVERPVTARAPGVDRLRRP